MNWSWPFNLSDAANLATILFPILLPLAGFAYKRWKQRKQSGHGHLKADATLMRTENVYSVAHRFLALFQAHEIEPIQIPKFLGAEFGLTPADLRSDEALLLRLNDTILTTVCDRFGVRREWLDGEDEMIYPFRHVYKCIPEFIPFLAELKRQYGEVEAHVFKTKGVQLNQDSHFGYLALVFAVPAGVMNDRIIYRYFPVTDAWPWDHLPARRQFKAIIYITRRLFGIYIRNHELATEQTEQIADGQCFPGEAIKAAFPTRWHAEDYVYLPHESPVSQEEEDFQSVLEMMSENGWREAAKMALGAPPKR